MGIVRDYGCASTASSEGAAIGKEEADALT